MADIQVANTDANLSGNTLLTEENAYTITGLHTYNRSTNPPFAVVSGAAKVDNLDADKLDGQTGTYYAVAANVLLKDGSVALTANWDAGAYEIRSATFESDIATGTAPLVIASTTKVTNLNADLLDGQTGTYYAVAANVLLKDGSVALTANWDAGGYEIRSNTFESDVATGTAPLTIASTTLVANLNADLLDGQEGSYYLAAANATGTLSVAQGGTGATSLTDGGLLLGSGTGAVTALGVATNGQIPIGDGSGDPQLATITGTSNQIDVTNGAASITLSLSSSYVGQSSITTLGTIGTGTWQGTTVGVGYGGTGLSSYAAGDVIYASGTTTLAKLAKATDGDVLTLASGVPSWATPTVGDITAVTAGAGMTGGGTTGDVTLNVIGTADKITVSADALTIASTYIGQTSITTLGTVGTGTWQGTAVANTYVADDLTISGGTVNNSVIGGSTPAAGTFTQVDVTAEGDLRLQDNSGGEYVGLDAPATVSGSYTLTMPAAVGAVGEALTLSNTDGTLEWASASGDITSVVAGAGMTGGGTSGDVTLNVIGTTDKITVSADAVTIASGYVGQTSITTLGTVGTGTWEGTDVGVAHGGTGVSTLTDGGILLGSGAGAITALGVAANGQIPVGDGSGDPVLATITGTTEQVTVTNGSGSITLSLPIGDYEVGTFNPTYYGQTTAGSLSGTPEGRYTRIGRTITVYVDFNGVTMTGAAGKARIGGFPSNIESPTAIACPQQYGLPISADYNTIYLVSNVADIYTNGDGAGWVQEDVYNGTFYLTFTATYEFA